MTAEPKRKPGRPRTIGDGRALSCRIKPEQAAILDTYPCRSQAVRDAIDLLGPKR